MCKNKVRTVWNLEIFDFQNDSLPHRTPQRAGRQNLNLKLVRVTRHFTIFLREKSFFFLKRCYFLKNQYFWKRLWISLDIFIYEMKKFVLFFQIENFGPFTASHIKTAYFESMPSAYTRKILIFIQKLKKMSTVVFKKFLFNFFLKFFFSTFSLKLFSNEKIFPEFFPVFSGIFSPAFCVQIFFLILCLKFFSNIFFPQSFLKIFFPEFVPKKFCFLIFFQSLLQIFVRFSKNFFFPFFFYRYMAPSFLM